ncbi:ubiquitin carboxyl-terminal hydrolase 40-like isoform X3 [Halichondria panicea]|uniref:ubiquitin carboxyl-terminal hydrolase 40-like isoform X3 n=1 Tax=Halichondria panicea TaxID=6063 RepID=UPI00312B713B
MLEGLFDEETVEYDAKSAGDNESSRVPRPPTPRNNTRLCGLSNLGATCYLNSLLQTLHFTPELREELFKLTETELGIFSTQEGADNSMVRVIPVQLQKLFANLLLLNQQSCSVDALTNSFGWSNSEEFQQHDVQELNRILFSAIESSLLGTSGEQLISKLYHGVFVQQIICQVCGRVSEREQEYLDLAMALSTSPTLEGVLQESYIEQELLEGANQYRCEKCGKLVDAKRGCKIRQLPQILTIALLRFLYDYEKGERYKDTSKFKFPLELDMAPYCEDGSVGGSSVYELFSVVIHSGSTHSGHYTAYIRDIDGLGTWASPDEEVVQLPRDPASGSVDLIDFDNPADLMLELLKQCGGSATISKLTKALQDKTGVTWNKRFKKQFGPITKFLGSCPDLFSVNESNLVSLGGANKTDTQQASSGDKSGGSPLIVRVNVEQAVNAEGGEEAESQVSTKGDSVDAVRGGASESGQDKKNGGEGKKKPVKKESPPAQGQCWFEFNDTHVSPIRAKQMEKMYQGKQSAYMLFYRKKDMQRPPQALGNKLFGVPERFQVEVARANTILDQERYEYDIAINTLQLIIHFSLEFVLANGALQRIDEGSDPCVLSVDRRKSIGELKEAIAETYSSLYDADHVVIHTAKTLPAGTHLYDLVSGNDQTSVADAGITNNSQLFVWDGQTVGGEAIAVGWSCDPILLHVTYPSEEGECELSSGFPKNSTISQLRVSLSELLEIPPSHVTISHVKLSEIQDTQTPIVVLSPSKDGSTLEELKLQDGDRLTVERSIKKGVKSLAHSVADKHSKMLSVIIESRLLPLTDATGLYPVFPVEVGKDECVATLKTMALTTASNQQFIGECRLRGDDDVTGIGPPLYESQTLTDAGISPGQRIILESGQAPTSNQVALNCQLLSAGVSSVGVCEVILGRDVTVRECMCVMVTALGLTGGDWHLQRTNWCGEAADVLEDEDASLEQERLKSGDVLLLAEGRLPPKGFIRLQVYLYSPESSPSPHPPANLPQDIPLHLVPPSLCHPLVPGQLDEVGVLEISKEATVEELKITILTLPAMENMTVPLLGLLRVREVVNGRPAKIFKLHNHTLRRLKLSSGSKVACTVLPQEEDLQTTTVVFNLCVRLPGERGYGPHTEVVYDTSHSSTPYSLCAHVSQYLDMPLDRLRMAKHKLDSFEWIKMQDSHQSDSSKRGRKKGQAKVNIRNSPIMLKDGDTVGVKDLQYDPDDTDDFSTPLDDRGRAILAAIQEDKRQKRKSKGGGDILARGGGAKARRQEVGIKIFVPDYQAKQDQL